MKKPMSRLLASVLAAIMLINCMIVTALAADARVISMNYQPHPLYPGMNGNAVVEVDYGDSTGRGICVEPAKDGPAVGSTLSLSEADTTPIWHPRPPISTVRGASIMLRPIIWGWAMAPVIAASPLWRMR